MVRLEVNSKSELSEKKPDVWEKLLKMGGGYNREQGEFSALLDLAKNIVLVWDDRELCGFVLGMASMSDCRREKSFEVCAAYMDKAHRSGQIREVITGLEPALDGAGFHRLQVYPEYVNITTLTGQKFFDLLHKHLKRKDKRNTALGGESRLVGALNPSYIIDPKFYDARPWRMLELKGRDDSLWPEAVKRALWKVKTRKKVRN